jgi:uncharacterized SAM-binding protein YcdF (DUF218 family)
MIIFILMLLPFGFSLILFGAVRVFRLPGRRPARARTRARSFSRRLLTGSALYAVLFFWLNGCGVLPPLYDALLHAQRWPHTWPVAPAPGAESSTATIVLLGGGTEYTASGVPADASDAPEAPQLRPKSDAIEKVALVAQLYHTAVASGANAPLVIISGGNPQHHAMAEADNYAPELAKLGVPETRIIRENRSLNTYQNAKYVAPLLVAAGGRRVTLVTTALHMRRARQDFALFGIDTIPIAAPLVRARLTILPDWRNMLHADAALHELVGIAQLQVYHLLHWV